MMMTWLLSFVQDVPLSTGTTAFYAEPFGGPCAVARRYIFANRSFYFQLNKKISGAGC